MGDVFAINASPIISKRKGERQNYGKEKYIHRRSVCTGKYIH